MEPMKLVTNGPINFWFVQLVNGCRLIALYPKQATKVAVRVQNICDKKTLIKIGPMQLVLKFQFVQL